MTLPRIAAALCGLAFLLAGCGGLSPAIEGGPARGPVTVDTSQGSAAASAISAYRRSRGLQGVTVDAELTAMAAQQATTIARTGTFSHDAGGSFSSRLAQNGVRQRQAAENLSAGSGSLDQVLRRWQGSSGHDANLLMPAAARIGIARATAPGSRFGQYWVLVLAD